MKKKHKQYIVTFVITVFSVVVLCLAINIIMDPLWYFNGNRYKKFNFGFDERLTKTNQLLKKLPGYDCFIFGSSRTTVLNETLIENCKCFNYSFSGGRIGEFNAFASYIKAKGIVPRRVIIGVDDFNFMNIDHKENIPDFISTKSEPRAFISSYLSLDALKFSFRLLRNESPFPRYYDANFIGNIKSTAPRYNPSFKPASIELMKLKENELLGLLGAEPLESLNFRISVVQKYRQLQTVFDSSEFTGYVPPVSLWVIASKDKERLSRYLDSIFRISRFISPFYDFSIPSKITANQSNTCDGSHYNLQTNRLIIDCINQKSQVFGVRIDTLTREEYFNIYQQALIEFLVAKQGPNSVCALDSFSKGGPKGISSHFPFDAGGQVGVK